jgi:hypothetical protein
VKTRAILSSTVWRDYSFSVPLAAILWREVAGIEPFVIVVGDWQAQERTRIAYDLLRRWEIEHKIVAPVEGYEPATTAQSARQHACVLPAFEHDEWLLLSDADLFPICGQWFRQHENQTGGRHVAVLYYANGDHYQSFPTACVGMSTSSWLKTMGLMQNGDLEGQLKETFDTQLRPRMQGLSPSDAAFKAWCFDQHYMSERIKAQPWFAGGGEYVFYVERRGHPPMDRLDRGCWPAGEYRLSDYVDAHIFKGPDEEAQWTKLRRVLSELVPGRMAEIEVYRESHVRSYK